MSAIFLSDVHLLDGDSVKTRLVIRFLQEEAAKYERLYILGDLFDVWPGTSTQLVEHFDPVLRALRCLVQEGRQVHYVEGNHDFRLGSYFEDELGIEVHPDSHTEDFGGRRVFMVHGDLGNPRDLGYKALRFLLRRDFVHMVKEFFPEDWIFQLGKNTSKASRKYSRTFPAKETAIRQTYRKTAEDIFRAGYDVVLMGHTHLPDDVTTLVDGRTCRYINLGDWVRHFTYLVFDGTQFYTKTHPVRDL